MDRTRQKKWDRGHMRSATGRLRDKTYYELVSYLSVQGTTVHALIATVSAVVLWNAGYQVDAGLKDYVDENTRGNRLISTVFECLSNHGTRPFKEIRKIAPPSESVEREEEDDDLAPLSTTTGLYY